MRYLLDEHLSPVIARLCRDEFGLDTVCVDEIGRKGRSDEEQLAFAAAEGRCFITRDSDDFIDLTYKRLNAGSPHAGILIVPVSLAGDNFAGIARAIARYEREHPQGMPAYMVDYLRPR